MLGGSRVRLNCLSEYFMLNYYCKQDHYKEVIYITYGCYNKYYVLIILCMDVITNIWT